MDFRVTAAATGTAIALVVGAIYLARLKLRIRRRRPLNMEQFKGLPRLPKFGVPKRYVLELRPDLEACKFDGKLAVTLDVVDKTKYLVLNAADLVIKDKSVSLRGTASTEVKFPSNVGLDAEDEILVIEFDEALPQGEAILAIEFQGTLNDQMKGFYRSTYVIDGEKRNMAVTQFEPADARRCFPCWDEPAYKVQL
ncbi:hypothetical protein KI387_029567 [Taxus chinensis]|uniref:Aminopeptidase N-like N-terminal domain-containing protein n=1 Tax=Taxus chinensis TaxID=29808 RepID=A0AA38CD45_TAXCH|nr:hypothetical protein KI387_029567 [Taxus chinensis]